MARKGDDRFIYWFSELGIQDVPLVGGKNASLGEMFAQLTDKGVVVPNGFAISAHAYNHYIDSTGLRAEIRRLLEGLDVSNVRLLAERGEQIREVIKATPLPEDLRREILGSYDELCGIYGVEVDTAVRSSATAEDLPDASFAGQQDTFLNIHGHEALVTACRACFASLFTDRAIAYREANDFDHFQVALSIAVQKMVRADLASAGVMFSIDTESGFQDAVYVTGGYGLGENVVQGSINPDEWYVHKPTLLKGKRPVIYSRLGAKQQKMIYTDPGHGKATEDVPVPQEDRDRFCLNDDEVLTLAKWACIIEDHYSQEAGHYKPMDMEWAKDGQTGDLFIVQARPETVMSRRESGIIRRQVLEKTSRVLAEGLAVGDSIGTGPADVIKSAEAIEHFKEGSVLVTEMTDPDWVPIMKIASAIVTDQGGRTCHAAIISRELGIPCIVGTGNASAAVQDGQEITVSCAGGSKGQIYDGVLPYHTEEIRLDQLEMPEQRLWFQQSNVDRAFPESQYPVEGVGLLRVDEIIRDEVKVHPLACAQYDMLDPDVQQKVDEASKGYPDQQDFFVRRVAQGVAVIAASVYPKPVRALLSDAPSNDLDRLIGGRENSLEDPNPLLGTRGAARYTDLDYEDAATLELQALAMVRNEMGLDNVSLVLPAAHSDKELKAITALLEQNGLKRGSDGLEHHLLVRTPGQVLTLERLGETADGFVVDVGELAQLTQGMDARNVRVRSYFQEDHPAVAALLQMAVERARAMGKPLGLTNIPPGSLRAYAEMPAVRGADYLIIRPDLFGNARETLIDAERTPGAA